MTSRRLLIPAALAASAALAPVAAAQTPPPTLQFDRACYAEDQPMNFTGAGYAPGADVELSFTKGGARIGSFGTTADPAGALANFVMAHEDDVLADGEEREPVAVTAADGTAQSAPATFTFTRWAGFSPGRLVPGRQTWTEAYGWAFAEGRTAYFLFRRRDRTVASVRLGALAGPCGDLEKRFTVPRRLRPGTYKAYLSTTRARPSDRGTWRRIRVVRDASPRRAIAAAAAPARMHRAG